MGDKMRKLSQEIEKDEELKMAVSLILLRTVSSTANMALFRNLDDPGGNEEVRALLNNILKEHTPSTDDGEVDINDLYKRIREKFIRACQKVGIEL